MKKKVPTQIQLLSEQIRFDIKNRPAVVEENSRLGAEHQGIVLRLFCKQP